MARKTTHTPLEMAFRESDVDMTSVFQLKASPNCKRIYLCCPHEKGFNDVAILNSRQMTEIHQWIGNIIKTQKRLAKKKRKNK